MSASTYGYYVECLSTTAWNNSRGVVERPDVRVAPRVVVERARAAPQQPREEITFAAAEPPPAWTDPLMADEPVQEPPRAPPANNAEFEDFMAAAKRGGF